MKRREIAMPNYETPRGQSWREFTVFNSVLERARQSPAQGLCIAAPNDDEDTLRALKESMELDLITDPILIGDEDLTLRTLESVTIDPENVEIISCPDPAESARRAAHMVGSGDADLLMKGRVPTAEILRAVLDPANNLRRTGEGGEAGHRLISHLSLFDIEWVPKVMGVTDAGVNIAPDLEAKKDLVRNAAEVFRVLVDQTPKVALLAAVEKVNENMPATLEARAVQEAADEGELGEVTVQGPLSLDCAVDERAASGKGVVGPVAGSADVIVTPDIEAGNIVAKSMMYFARGIMAGILVGTNSPVIVNSRVDVPASRLASILCAVVLSQASQSG